MQDQTRALHTMSRYILKSVKNPVLNTSKPKSNHVASKYVS